MRRECVRCILTCLARLYGLRMEASARIACDREAEAGGAAGIAGFEVKGKMVQPISYSNRGGRRRNGGVATQ